MTINSFTDRYDYLSNFHKSVFAYGGQKWPTVEHAFQAYKTTDVDEFLSIWAATTPGIAKRKGRTVTLRDDWEEIKIPLMTALVRRKFASNNNLTNALISTGDQALIEGNTWGDTFWGVCNGVGENHLGIILMHVREELKIERNPRNLIL